MTLISSKNRKARKEHRCDWCGSKINKGEIYRSSFNVNDGEGYTWKNHLHCDELAERLKMFEDCDSEGLSEDKFRDSINEAYFEIMSDFYNEIYESDGFTIPSFPEKIEFLKTHFKINQQS